ncbi:MAG: PHP domain-containing protein [Nitrospinales bacterium]
MVNRRFEIHMHSTFSDGEFSPTELVQIAKKNNVKTLALTDHDTFIGVDELVVAAKAEGINAFPGIEITAKYRDFNVHLLCYFSSLDSIKPELRDRVEKMREARDERMRQLITRVDEVIPERFRGQIQFENVRRAAEGVVARPHLAREMVRLGIVNSVRDAFDKYLVKYNIEKENLEVKEAIELARSSGGIPVLAHPGERTYSIYNPEKGKDKAEALELLKELKSFGLLGIECVYPYHEKIGAVDYFLGLADELDLIATGSRDFHGFNYNQKEHYLGTTEFSDSFLEKFQQAWS